MPIEGVAALLAVGYHVDTGRLLQRYGFIYRMIFDGLERGRCELPRFQLRPRLR
jgi:hypothetical protein